MKKKGIGILLIAGAFLGMSAVAIEDWVTVKAPLAHIQADHQKEGRQEGLSWYTNYQEALRVARLEDRPICLFFTGSDWCRACMRAKKEALNTPEFAAAIGERVLFVEVDLPRRSDQQSPVLRQQNQELQRRFGVNRLPTWVLINADEHLIGTITGYSGGGGTAFAQQLLAMLPSEDAKLHSGVAAH